MEYSWLDSVYSDGTAAFVSDPTPDIGGWVDISIRFLADAPVRSVMIRLNPNGAERYDRAKRSFEKNGLVYYTARIPVNEYRIQYQFDLITDDCVYFYTQKGITTYIPDHTCDFVLLSDYHQPEWVEGAVFYQIFPERFCNGNPADTVASDEYEYMGYRPVSVTDWYSRPAGWQQAHGMDFYGGDLYGIIDKLDYLQDLGVTALYVNPVFSSYSTHKYDCIDYYHVDPHFGGDEALEKLCSELHARDMKIILDISINHTGIRHKWIQEDRPFYFRKEDGSYQGWFGVDTLPVLDYRSEELRRLIYKDSDSVLRKWLKKPYCIDGWRFDVADVFARNDRVQLAKELWPEICDAIREENPDAFIIGEDWGDCSGYLQGHLWNTPMNYFGFGRIIRQYLGLNDLLLERYREFDVSYCMTAKDVNGRTSEHYGKIPQVIGDCQMNLFDSHDIARLHNFESITFDKWRMAVTAQLLWTGIPCIYYGDEAAIDGYTSEDAGCRFPMPWDRVTPEGRRHFDTIRIMTGLRREHPAFSKGGRKVIYDEGRILAVARFFEEEIYVGVLSMEDCDTKLTLPLFLIGAESPAGERDCFGEEISGSRRGSGRYELTIRKESSLLFRVS